MFDIKIEKMKSRIAKFNKQLLQQICYAHANFTV